MLLILQSINLADKGAPVGTSNTVPAGGLELCE